MDVLPGNLVCQVWELNPEPEDDAEIIISDPETELWDMAASWLRIMNLPCYARFICSV